MNRPTAGVVAALLLGALPAFSFEDWKPDYSYHRSRALTLGTGLGYTSFVGEEGISGDIGFGFTMNVGHHFNRFFEARLTYQFSFFDLHSPDPIDPSVSLTTGAGMHQQSILFLFSYPTKVIQPYVGGGFGGYDIFNVDKATALDFPYNMMVPAVAGVRTYFYKNLMSADAEFSYQFLFGENQTADTLAFLNLSKVSLNAYSLMVGVTFHLL